MKKWDVIVIGVGSMGSAACYQLAKRGAHVLGLEQYDITHELGSHAGQSRLIRKAYFEHPDYVPLLLRAYEGWQEIENLIDKQLYWQTGIAYFAPEQNPIIQGIRSSARQHNIVLTNESVDIWPQFSIPPNFCRVFEPEAGFLTPEAAIRSFAQVAQQYGAEIHTHERVMAVNPTANGVEVVTDKSTYSSSKVILTAGAYTAGLIDLQIPLVVTRQLLAWAHPKNPGFGLGEMPCWMIAEQNMEGLYYGFPTLPVSFDGPSGLKIAYHRAGERMIDPTETTFDAKAEHTLLTRVLNQYLPRANATIEELKQCRYTYTPDEHFMVDQLRTYGNRVILAAGFSGHGFKFVPVIGEVLADLVIDGATRWPVDFLGMKRFETKGR
jgi:sarcosine oxidase